MTQGPKITEFEYAFARYVGAKYAVAVNNATAGLHLAVSSLAVKPGDKVIVTPMTFELVPTVFVIVGERSCFVILIRILFDGCCQVTSIVG